jgi:hypothetical protein
VKPTADRQHICRSIFYTKWGAAEVDVVAFYASTATVTRKSLDLEDSWNVPAQIVEYDDFAGANRAGDQICRAAAIR